MLEELYEKYNKFFSGRRIIIVGNKDDHEDVDTFSIYIQMDNLEEDFGRQFICVDFISGFMTVVKENEIRCLKGDYTDDFGLTLGVLLDRS